MSMSLASFQESAVANGLEKLKVQEFAIFWIDHKFAHRDINYDALCETYSDWLYHYENYIKKTQTKRKTAA